PSEMLLLTKRTEPSHSDAFTPPLCRLRAALYCAPAVVTGMAGSPLGIAQLTTSGADELGVSSVMNLNTPSSFWMSPRQSLSSWLLAMSVSDIKSVWEVPSVTLVILTTPGTR